MPYKVYDYRCLACGNIVEDKFVHSDVADDQYCDECEGKMKRLLCAPSLDITGMAAAGCPGAHEKVGNDLEKKHRAVDQHHRKAGS
jgi:putative FmdB family regulatory protein